MLNVCKLNLRASLIYIYLKKECGLLNPHELVKVVPDAAMIDIKPTGIRITPDDMRGVVRLFAFGNEGGHYFVSARADFRNGKRDDIADGIDGDGILHGVYLLAFCTFIIA